MPLGISFSPHLAKSLHSSIDFRMIPLGDIDLQHEIRLDRGSVVVGYRHAKQASVRRVYSARVDGRETQTTVAVYQGPGAEEVCCSSPQFSYDTPSD
jgi:hypothetical protein